MIDIRKLKELVKLMVSNGLTELDLRDNEEQVTLRRHNMGGGSPTVMTQSAAPVVAVAPPEGAPAPASSGPAGSTAEGRHMIESPMVGTFYTSPDPDSAAFVNVGDHVNPETVVCLIEAMKIFNEIKAECSGTIEKVLATNAEAVEFGQPLFAVRPD